MKRKNVLTVLATLVVLASGFFVTNYALLKGDIGLPVDNGLGGDGEIDVGGELETDGGGTFGGGEIDRGDGELIDLDADIIVPGGGGTDGGGDDTPEPEGDGPFVDAEQQQYQGGDDIAYNPNPGDDTGSDDDDGDGLTNDEEDDLGTYKNDSDSDNDGLNDGDEIDEGTDPLVYDTDGDSSEDGEEIDNGTDPLNPDSDEDGIEDGDESEMGTDPTDADTDGDGEDDGEEVDGDTDPLDAESNSISGTVIPDGLAVPGVRSPTSGVVTASGAIVGSGAVAVVTPIYNGESISGDDEEDEEETESTDEEVEEEDEETEVLADDEEDEEEEEEVVVVIDEEDEDDTTTVLDNDCIDPFVDTEDHWAEIKVCELYVQDVVDGKSTNLYVPNDYMTRAEFIKVLMGAAGFELGDASGLTESYTDVYVSDWYSPWIAMAESEGILRNQGGAYRPNDPVTRADAAVLTVRLAGLTLYGYTEADIDYFDVHTTDYFAYAVILSSDEVVMVEGEGNQSVIEGYGDGSFRPYSYMTRAEVATMLLRAQLAWF